MSGSLRSSANGARDVWNYALADGNVWIRKTSGTNDILNLTDIASTGVLPARL
jgi:hypothetical protein